MGGPAGISVPLPPTVLQVPPELAGLRADAFLFRELPAVSRSRVRQKIQMGESLLNGHRYSTSTRLRPGDVISVTWRAIPRFEAVVDLEILFEDDALLAVNKLPLRVKPTAVRCAPGVLILEAGV